MGIRSFFIFVIVILFSTLVHGQVRVIQWPDVHSSLKDLAWLTQNIDQVAQEHRKSHPDGEVVIAVLGDFTSHSPDTRAEQGWMSFQALKFLRQRGYTVIFVPGNHDAFDWKFEANGVELFIEQMKALKSWGAHVLAANLQGLAPDLQGIIEPHYDLQGTQTKTRLVGMTLANLIGKSNLDMESARRMFERVRSYDETWREVIERAREDGVQNLIVGTHDAFYRLRDQRNHIRNVIAKLNKRSGEKDRVDLSVPLMMSAHDHMTATTLQRGTVISGAGSHGSFTVVDFARDGKMIENSLKHFAWRKPLQNDRLVGQFEVGEYRIQNDIFPRKLDHHILEALDREISNYLDQIHRDRGHVERLLMELDADVHLKGGRHLLGRLFSETLLSWVGQAPWYNGHAYHGVVTIVDPGSHDLKKPFNRLTSYKNAMVFETNGDELGRLYHSFRRHRLRGGAPVYQPQLNKGFRPSKHGVEMLEANGETWRALGEKDRLLVVIDAWLVSERYNDKNSISERELLRRLVKLDRAPYLSILLDYLPEVLAKFGERARIHRAPMYGCTAVFGAP